MPHISLSQVSLLLGGLILLGGGLALLLYGVHKVFQRRAQDVASTPTLPARGTEGALLIASLQEVIRRMRMQEKDLREQLRVAEQYARVSETVIQELPCAVLVLDGNGHIIRSNRQVRPLLGIDTWSRRRYSEVLGPESELARLVQECLDLGKSFERVTIRHLGAGGRVLDLAVSLAPVHSPGGSIEGAVCLLLGLGESATGESRWTV